MTLLGDFERIVTIKALITDIDLNYLCKANLDKIIEIATDLEIPLNCLDYDKIEYDSQYDLIEQVYYEWFDDIYEMYLDIKNGLLELT